MPTESILVTGANGLLGRNLCARLRQAGPTHELVHTLADDLRDRRGVQTIDFAGAWSICDLPKSVSAIVHLAQSSRFREFPVNAPDVFKVNVDSTARLLDYAVQTGVRKFVFASSGGVYAPGNSPFQEQTAISTPGNLNYYLGGKLCGEILAKCYVGMMQIIVLRFFFIYGPRQNRTMLIPRLVDNVKSGRKIVLGAGDGIRINPIHVDDAALAVQEVLRTNESATYNIAGPRVYSIREIGEIAGKKLGVEPRFEHIDQPVRDIVADIELMKSRLHIPRTTFEEGVCDVIEGTR